MQTADHFGFIAAAYIAAVIIIGALSAWVMLDYHAQRRALIDLDKRGVTRRSGPPRPEQPIEQAKQEAKEKA
jgi:heme exporter protein D